MDESLAPKRPSAFVMVCNVQLTPSSTMGVPPTSHSPHGLACHARLRFAPAPTLNTQAKHHGWRRGVVEEPFLVLCACLHPLRPRPHA